VVLGPVDAAEHVHDLHSPRFVSWCAGAKPCRSRTLPNGRAHRPAIRLAVRDPSSPQDPGPGWSSKAPVSVRGPSCGWQRPRPPCRPRAPGPRQAPGVSHAIGAAGGAGDPGLITRIESLVYGADHPAPAAATTTRPCRSALEHPPALSLSGMDLASRPRCLGRGLQALDRYGGDLLTCPLGSIASAAKWSGSVTVPIRRQLRGCLADWREPPDTGGSDTSRRFPGQRRPGSSRRQTRMAWTTAVSPRA
jgi:hypothetical protein